LLRSCIFYGLGKWLLCLNGSNKFMNVCTILCNVSLAAPVLYFQRFKLRLSRIKVSFVYSYLCGLSSSQSSSSASLFHKIIVLSFLSCFPSVWCHSQLTILILTIVFLLGIFIFVSCLRNLSQSLQYCNIATSCWSLVCHGIFLCMLDFGSLWILVFGVSDFCDHPF